MTHAPVWPMPQEITLRDDALPLGRAALLAPPRAKEADLAPVRLFADLVADEFGLALPIARSLPAGALPIEIKIAGRPGAGRTPRSLPGAEGYLLTITAEGAHAVGRDARGAQHAAATLIQLVERRGREVVLRGAQVRDWPYKPLRMVHLYLPGPDHLAYARRYLRDFLVRYKFNGLFVEVGGGVRLRTRPEIPVAWRRFVEETLALGDTLPVYGAHRPLNPGRRCTNSVHTRLGDGTYLEPDDVAHLWEWARAYHLEAIPEIPSLSHAYYLACAHPEIAEIAEAELPDTYCPSHPESRALRRDVMAEYIDLTKCRSVHIGHDEWRSAGFCPRCRGRDTGELFAEDVIEIASWLNAQGQHVWMWGDHLLPKHTAEALDSDTGTIWYDFPQTRQAAELIAKAGLDMSIVNWSWALGSFEEIEARIAGLGFRQMYGNFDGQRFQEWDARSGHESVLGAEISSWCAWDDFELGMLHYPNAMYSANLLWSNHWPAPAEAEELAAGQLPKLRDRMRRDWSKPRLWSEATGAHRKHVISIREVCNAPLQGADWDLSGLAVGRHEREGIPYEIVDPAANGGRAAVVVERLHAEPSEYPHASQPIPVGAAYAGLIFWQVAAKPGLSAIHAGEGTNYPREAGDLLGWYEIRFADGLVRTAEIRYGENVQAWNESFQLLYRGRELRAGTLPDGRPLVIWGCEWSNTRPEVEIVSIVMHGARGLPELRLGGRVSDARPMLLGLTGVEKWRWEDFRPGQEGKLPGWEAGDTRPRARGERPDYDW